MRGKCSVDGCKNNAHARTWCRKHYMRFYTHGNVGTVLKPMPPLGEVARFFEFLKTVNSDDCVHWPFGTNGVGYGLISIEGKRQLVTRVLCKWKYGPAPAGHVAAHSCGNGHLGCVNHRHLKWKTEKENREDMVAHGTRLYGEDITQAKLTENQVREIRRLRGFLSQSLIAARFGVSQSTISQIHLGKKWRHVDAL